jgi:3-methyladenine DNA glycosylase Mpg
MPLVERRFFFPSAAEVARELIGCYLFTKIGDERTGGMIFETEAYDEDDPFGHCYRRALIIRSQ